MSPTTYLITGSNRGLGRALVAALLLREDTTVVAAVRDPNHETATGLQDLPRQQSARVAVVKVDGTTAEGPLAAVQELRDTYGINALDVVIANAGLFNSAVRVSESTVEGLLEHYRVNSIGPVLLYQATRPLLLNAKNPKFIVTSGSGGSIRLQEKILAPLAEYGASRAAVNWLFRKVHFEEQAITTVLIDPGLMDTKTGDLAITHFGVDKSALQSVDECAERYLEAVDNASKTTTSGTFVSIQNKVELDW